jgi:hypothetical protein
MNWYIFRLLVLVFLGSVALVRRAQNEFYNEDENSLLHSMLRFHGGDGAASKRVDQVTWWSVAVYYGACVIRRSFSSKCSITLRR